MEHRKEFFAIFREIDVKNQTKEDYTPTLSEQYEHVQRDNFEEYSRVACLQYVFIKENPNLSAFYFVDWRVEFSKLEAYILNNVPELHRIEAVLSFMNYYEESESELYKRLDLPDYDD